MIDPMTFSGFLISAGVVIVLLVAGAWYASGYFR